MMVYFCRPSIPQIANLYDFAQSGLELTRLTSELTPRKTPKSFRNGSKKFKFFILLFSNLIFRNQKPFLIKIVNVLDSVLLL